MGNSQPIQGRVHALMGTCTVLFIQYAESSLLSRGMIEKAVEKKIAFLSQVSYFVKHPYVGIHLSASFLYREN